MDDLSPEERFAELLQQDPRYRREAYAFVFEALDYTVRKCHGEEAAGDPPASRHVSGQDLLEGIRCFALESFGCLAAAVFESWGIRTSEDIGEIVFNLVRHGLMGKQDSDQKIDFVAGYGGRTFAEILNVRPSFEYCPERDEWRASYESAASA